VGVRVAQRSEAIIVFLSSRIPKSEFDMPLIDLDVRNVGLKHCWNINLKKQEM